ncbi:uncharacterized protein LOC125227478 [Leguminivora glycinivorella]|uniref:uncharacterized protein LOC125227478 n=1 Tax=Leguminivora glycinivorella TaxID=1035111 RepID=UPI00200D54CD|nr:uncharacterized protein LOC125227478 [Leguminivora glycinivorella]
MSPLACSLLAFTALFATADAVDPINYCGSLLLGKKTEDQIDFRITAPGGDVSIPDKCARPGRKLVGEYIYVCDPGEYQPTVSERREGPPFSLVNIDCPSDVGGCSSLDVQVTQHCEDVTGPH